MGRTLDNFIKNVKENILESMDHEGYLQGEELSEYIELACIDRQFNSSKEKAQTLELIRSSIVDSKRYYEGTTKRMCAKCKSHKYLKEFYQDRRWGNHSYGSYCKKCMNEVSGEWYENNKEKHAEYSRKSYLKNKKKQYISKKKSNCKRRVEDRIGRKLTNEEKEKVYRLCIKDGLTPKVICLKLFNNGGSNEYKTTS